jgi:hypothetical protein
LLQRCGTANPFGQILNLTELTAVFVGLWNKIAVVYRSGCALCYSTSFSLLLWFSCISKVSKCRWKLKMLSVNPSAQNSQNSRNQNAIKKHTFVANFCYISSPNSRFAFCPKHLTHNFSALCTCNHNPTTPFNTK